MIGTDGNVWHWGASGFSPVAMGAVPANSSRRISAATESQAAVLTTSNDVYELISGTWTLRSGKRCVDIAYRAAPGIFPVLYCAGTDGKPYRLIGGAWSLITNLVSSVVRIAAGPITSHPEWATDVIWVVRSDGGVLYSTDGASWPSAPKPKLANGSDGSVKDIGVGIDGAVWIVGGDAVAGGSAIYIWNEQVSRDKTPSRKQWWTIGQAEALENALRDSRSRMRAMKRRRQASSADRESCRSQGSPSAGG